MHNSFSHFWCFSLSVPASIIIQETNIFHELNLVGLTDYWTMPSVPLCYASSEVLSASLNLSISIFGLLAWNPFTLHVHYTISIGGWNAEINLWRHQARYIHEPWLNNNTEICLTGKLAPILKYIVANPKMYFLWFDHISVLILFLHINKILSPLLEQTVVIIS